MDENPYKAPVELNLGADRHRSPFVWLVTPLGAVCGIAFGYLDAYMFIWWSDLPMNVDICTFIFGTIGATLGGIWEHRLLK